MESYVIRIYRRGQATATDIIGTVEAASTGGKQSFHNAGELISLLTAPDDEGVLPVSPTMEKST